MVFIEDFLKSIGKGERVFWYLALRLLPVSWIRAATAGGGKSTPDDLCTIMFSSGSTGDAEGRDAVARQRRVQRRGDRADPVDPARRPHAGRAAVLPQLRLHGDAVGAAASAASARLPPQPAGRQDDRRAGREAPRHASCISHADVLPAYLRKLRAGDFATLRYVLVGAEKLRAGAGRGSSRRSSASSCWKATAAPRCRRWWPSTCRTSTHAGDSRSATSPGTVGQPLPGVAARVVDPETREPLPHGQEGLLLVNGANVMIGYLADAEATAEVLRDGWYVTGDIARVDEDGFITITDRLSRFTKIGGEMVPHLKIEEALHACPAIERALRHRGPRRAARRAAGRLLCRERGDGAAAGVAGLGRVRPAEDLDSESHRSAPDRDPARARHRQNRPQGSKGASGRGSIASGRARNGSHQLSYIAV